MIPVKPGKAGGNAVNRLCRKWLRGMGHAYGLKYHLYENDRIIMNHNNYPCGYMNGDGGILDSDS